LIIEEILITIRELLNLLKDGLGSAGIESSTVEAEVILSHFLSMKRYELYLFLELEITAEVEIQIKDILEKRCSHYPLQYLIDNVEFYDTIIKVNPSVLIPRPETELLVEKVLADNALAGLQVLDIGTGSGAIAIALKKKRPDWQITATDISAPALETARHNAELNNCEIDFILSDLWANISGKFDIIISNPPYISEQEYENLAVELQFEPVLALKAPEDGLYYYKRILHNCLSFLKPAASIYLEIGAGQAEAIKQIAAALKPVKVNIFQDYQGYDRIFHLIFQ
jgi:release factor glutamine methyltransferase